MTRMDATHPAIAATLAQASPVTRQQAKRGKAVSQVGPKRKTAPVKTQRKYGNKKVVVDGIQFDSKREAARYVELKLLLANGAIADLELQPAFELQPGFRDARTGRKERAITYIADFRYIDVATGRAIVEDAKGMKTAVFQLKRKLFLRAYPDLLLLLV